MRERYRFLPVLPSLEHSHIHLFTYHLWLCSCYNRSVQFQNHTAHEVENISQGMRAKLLQSCLTPCYPMDCSMPCSSVHRDALGKNTEVGYRALLQGIFLPPGSNLHLLPLLFQLLGSLPLVPPGKPYFLCSP